MVHWALVNNGYFIKFSQQVVKKIYLQSQENLHFENSFFHFVFQLAAFIQQVTVRMESVITVYT